MKYYVMFISNGNLQLNLEKGDVTELMDIDKAKAKFHSLCNTMWSAKDVITGYVAIIDNQFDIVEGYKEFIHHDEQPVTPEPTPEDEEGV